MLSCKLIMLSNVLAAHLCNTREVDQCEVHNMWREDFEMNGFITDALQRTDCYLELQLVISHTGCNYQTLFIPEILSVSASISCLISSKSAKI